MTWISICRNAAIADILKCLPIGGSRVNAEKTTFAKAITTGRPVQIFKRMQALFIALALILALPAVAAEDRPPVTIFSKASPNLRLVERSDSYENGSFARWIGRLDLTGKLVLEFDRAPADEPESENAGAAIFEPDLMSREKLPRAKNYYALAVEKISLGESAIDVLTPLLGRPRALKVVLSKIPRYELAVAITLTSFRTDVECDHRSYSMEYSSIKLITTQVTAIAEGNGIGC